MVEIAEHVECPSCGAPLKAGAGEVIVTCEYCGSAVNMGVGEVYFLKHSIIPNRYDKNHILEQAREWMKAGFVKPKDLATSSKFDDVHLTFLPFFIIQLIAKSEYNGFFTRTGQNLPKKGDFSNEYFWKIIARRGSSFPTREYEIPLSGKVDFDLSKVSKGAKFLNSEIDESTALTMTKKEISEHHKFLISSEVDVISEMNTDTEIKNTEFLHAPVWFIRYEYRGNEYELIMDGNTGRAIKGEIPPPDVSISGGFFKKFKKKK